ncbi:hypothetical protein DOK78_002023 [Enterococcus sp. DIV2402]|uniref:Uncharacterized protein n=1 Tax=Candidatus Enterococcus lowellii TaxID=2230877 RepID=A0ABZ2SNL9_9ENTE
MIMHIVSRFTFTSFWSSRSFPPFFNKEAELATVFALYLVIDHTSPLAAILEIAAF